jgi:hypothetical protein
LALKKGLATALFFGKLLRAALNIFTNRRP